MCFYGLVVKRQDEQLNSLRRIGLFISSALLQFGERIGAHCFTPLTFEVTGRRSAQRGGNQQAQLVGGPS
jgi:hypothetical protein